MQHNYVEIVVFLTCKFYIIFNESNNFRINFVLLKLGKHKSQKGAAFKLADQRSPRK